MVICCKSPSKLSCLDFCCSSCITVYDFVSSRLNLLKIFSACETVRNCFVMSSDSDEVDVLYCDYGTTEFVARSDIITQFPEVFQSSIHTVHLCHLDGLLPVGWHFQCWFLHNVVIVIAWPVVAVWHMEENVIFEVLHVTHIWQMYFNCKFAKRLHVFCNNIGI